MKNYCLIICVLAGFIAKAQKTPDIQAANMAAPAAVRVDGKASEWGDAFAADNKRTGLQYTLSNDDKNLYLVVKATAMPAINKLMLGGITLTVNTEGKKKDKAGLQVTYPLVKRTPRGAQGQGGFGRGNSGGAGGQGNTLTAAQRDSMSLVQHKTALGTAKEIKVLGVSAIPDSLVSIYNEYGLKAAASFDEKGAFIYELAVPLTLLDGLEKNKELAYQLKVNGFVRPAFGAGNGGNGAGANAGGANRGGNAGGFGGGNRGGGNRGGGGNFGSGAGNFGGGAGRMGGGANAMQDMMTPTDFWGKYTLL